MTPDREEATTATGRSRVLVTTSWDDGVQQDMRLAEMLAERGMIGTFYVCAEPGQSRPLTQTDMYQLRSMGMEIGAHTLTHPDLTRLSPDAMRREIRGSMERLEDSLGEPVRSFCYPFGAHNRAVVDRVAECGLSFARTTMGLRDGLDFDPLRAPVGVHVYTHSRSVHLRHALKEGNVAGLLKWVVTCHGKIDPVDLTRALATDTERHDGILHVWGHSWEIDQLGMWPMLKAMLDVLSAVPHAEHVDNHGLLPTQARGATDGQ